MIPWEQLARATAPDGTLLELRRRGQEYLIYAGGYDLMSSEDDVSSRALAELSLQTFDKSQALTVLVGGLGMGYTLQAALAETGSRSTVEVAELVPAVVQWNREIYGHLAAHPLADSRSVLVTGDVRKCIAAARNKYHAILLDVDNGPESLAHAANDALYSRAGLDQAWNALRPGGVLGVWSINDEPKFSARLQKRGFDMKLHKVSASRKGRGRYHRVWVARRS